jgi:mitogen-activated protein kinase kinase kinase 1
LGEELVNCLFSRNWSFRETGLKHLSKETVATLLRSAGEGRSGVIVSPTRQAATHAMLETTSKILAHMCADPVYPVFVASLVRVYLFLMTLRKKLQSVEENQEGKGNIEH